MHLVPRIARIVGVAFICVAAGAVASGTAPVFWAPPSPAEPDDTIYTSPFTFDSLSNGGTDEPDVGPEVRIAAAWQLLGGPTALPLVQDMSQEAETSRQRDFQQLPGGAGVPGAPSWVPLGPITENYWQNGTQPNPQINSGRLNTILVDPGSPDTVYVIAATGGLWKTTNFSQPQLSWSPKSDSIGTDGIGSGALGKNPQTIYLGTGDPFDSFFGGAVVRSTDGGDTWGPAVQLAASVTMDLKVDTSGSADVVLVGTNNGLFRSANGGASFASVGGFAGSSVWSLARTSAGWLAVVESNATGVAKMYYSIDRGVTWSSIPNGGNVYSGAGRTTLGVGTAGDAIVYAYAATTFDEKQLDLFRSIDGGLNWTAIGLAGKQPGNFDLFQQDMDLMGGQAFYNQAVLVDPTDATRNTVYIGGQLASARTTDGGNTWLLTTTWVPLRGPAAVVGNLPYVHADFHCMAFAVIGKRPTLMFGSDGGLFVSTDGGGTWDDTKNRGLTTHQIYAMSVNATQTSESMIGLQDNGTLYRLPNTATYNGVIGGDGFGTGWSQANNAVSIGSVYFSNIRRVVNNPPNNQFKFERAFNGIERSEAPFFTPLATPTAVADPSGLKFFTYTATRIYRTIDGAGLWNVIGRSGVNINLPAGRLFQGQHGLSVSPVDANRVIATAGGGWVAVSVDGGATWTVKQLIGTGPAPGYGGINVASSWASDHVIYVGSLSTSPARNHVVKSIDAGQTWQVADGGLPRLPLRKILTDPTDPSGNTVYVANVIGVYRTTNGGASWSRFGNGLPQADFSDLYIPKDGSFLRASSYGRGVWEVRLR
jgi:photosystem II stability/assembly factor-like uncharacterized protein